MSASKVLVLLYVWLLACALLIVWLAGDPNMLIAMLIWSGPVALIVWLGRSRQSWI